MLTPKQEKFCQKYIEYGDASKAYRDSYNAEKMKPETVNRTAKDMLDNPKIAARLEDLREKHQKRHEITVDDLLRELEEARQMGIDTANPSAMATATMGKAKILGLDKKVVELKNKSLQIEIVDAGSGSTD